MNDERPIFAGQTVDRDEERLKERNGRPWGEMGMNGGDEAGESARLLVRKRIN